MAITKAIRGPAKSHAGMRNTIEYVLRDDKVREGYVDMIGPSPDEINWDTVFRSFIDEKKTWGKDTGRMCSHYVLSFHKDEKITPEQALDLARELAEKVFPGFQVLLGVHQDKDHLHVHMVTNSVSYETGLKLHTKKQDLQRMKDITNELCKERGFSVAEKGKHFDGTAIEEGAGIAWSKDKYHLLNDGSKKSYLVECASAVMDARDASESQEEFIHEMGLRGWTVNWSDKRKHITFEDQEGHKVRDSNISKTFTIDISKEALAYEFERQKEKRRAAAKLSEQELDKYYKQVESEVMRGSGEAAGDEDRGTTGSYSRTHIDELKARHNATRRAEDESKAAAKQRRLAEQKRYRHQRRSEQGFGYDD